jgi:hypothetical protein
MPEGCLIARSLSLVYSNLIFINALDVTVTIDENRLLGRFVEGTPAESNASIKRYGLNFQKRTFRSLSVLHMLMLINGNTLVHSPVGERLTSKQQFLLGVVLPIKCEAFQLDPNGHITYHLGRTLN